MRRLAPLLLTAALLVACASSPVTAPQPALDAGASLDAGGTPDASADCAPTELATTLVELATAINDEMEHSGGADSQAMVVPTNGERDAFAATVAAVLDGDARAACELPPSYRWVHLQDPRAGGLNVVAEVDAAGKPAPAKYWGTYTGLSSLAEAPSRPLVIEAAHPMYDLNTWLEATDLFVQARARYLLVTGAERCANSERSDCTGTSDVCDDTPMPYRVSDAAHSILAPFYAVHVALSEAFPALSFLQIHGNSMPGCPDALLSDASGDWPASGLAEALAGALAPTGVTFGRCGLEYPTNDCDLCGGGNVEARSTADSTDACHKGGFNYGRFVHLEQSKGLRQTPSAGAPGYQRLIDAVLAASPAAP